jgi:hypothetical protein
MHKSQITPPLWILQEPRGETLPDLFIKRECTKVRLGRELEMRMVVEREEERVAGAPVGND